MDSVKEKTSHLSLYNNDMDKPGSYTKRFRQLRWKLTLSYTWVTVGALLTVELILLASTAIFVAILLNSGVIQTELINTASDVYTPPLQYLLSQNPPNKEEITSLLDRMGAAFSSTIPLTFNASDRIFVVGRDGILLGSRPQDLLGSGAVGRPVNVQSLPGLAVPLQAALEGDKDVNNLYTLPGPDANVIIALPIWDEAHERVLGALVGIGEFPTVQSALSSIIPIMGISFLIFTFIAGVAGTIYGSVSARGLSARLDRLSEGTHAWSQGDFSKLVEDTSGDEIGQLAYNLNQMAQELESLLDTRREFAILEERNRLARELHDSAKQQAFAAAGQVNAARTLLKRDPEGAQVHIDEAESLIRNLRRELGNLIRQLRPVELEGKGLPTALQDYAEDWSRQTGIKQEVYIHNDLRLSLKIEQAIFRIVQEALSNVARHSNASGMKIEIVTSDRDIICTLQDDGVGFDPKQKQNGFGLRSMRERAGVLGGILQIESTKDSGTLLTIRIPISQKGTDDKESMDG